MDKKRKIQGKERFLAIQRQREQQHELEKEVYAEESNLYLLTLNKGDVLLSTEGQRLARSLHAHISNWYKSMTDDAKDYTFLISGAEDALIDFQSYVLDKAKGKKKEEFGVAFESGDFIRDVKNLLTIKAYEHKGQMQLEGRTGFCSSKANMHYSLNKMLQDNRGFAHEATNRLAKCSFAMLDGTTQRFEPEQLEQIQEALQAAIESTIKGSLNDVQSNIALSEVAGQA